MKPKEKAVITFETQSNLHDDASAAVTTINQLIDDIPSCKIYKHGINKMYEFFNEIYEKNMKLLEKAQGLNTIIVANAAKINIIIKTTDQDKDALSKLKADFDEASKMVQFAHQSEQKSKKILAQLRFTLQELIEKVNKGEAFSFGSDHSAFEISLDVKNLQKEVSNGKSEIKELESEISAHSTILSENKDAISKYINETSKIEKQLSLLEVQLQELKTEVDDTSNSVTELQPIVKESSKQIEKIKKKKANIIEKKEQILHIKNELQAASNQAKDEKKHTTAKYDRRKRALQEIQRANSQRSERIAGVQAKIDEITEGNLNIDEKLNEQNLKQIELTHQVNELAARANAIAAEKQIARNRIKELRPQLVDGAFKISQEEAMIKATKRKMSHEKSAVSDVNIDTVEEKHEHNKLKNQNVFLKEETKAQKWSLQAAKDTINTLFHEIDETRSELFKTQANTQLLLDAHNVTNEENEKQMKELALLRAKALDQNSLSEKMREERNQYAQLLNQRNKENEDLRTQCNELAISAEEAAEKTKNLTTSTINDHFTCRKTYEEIDSLKEVIEQIRNAIHQTERVVSRLQAESQTLGHIYNEAKNDKHHQKKEHNILVKNLEEIKNAVLVKERAVNDLRAQIKTETSLLETGQSQYRDKLSELQSLHDKHKSLLHENAQLEKGIEGYNQCRIDFQKLSTELLVEKQKYVTLVHELAVPRNVHRWMVIKAVDPTYAKNLEYRGTLSGKIAEAARELESLEAERDRIKARIAEMEASNAKSLTRAQVEQYISKYKESLRQKDAEIKRIELQIRDTDRPVETARSQVTALRGKLTTRRESAAQLKDTIFRETRRSEGDAFFLTEANAPIIIGGGFNATFSRPPPLNRGRSSDLLHVGPTPVVSRIPTRRSSSRPAPYHGMNYTLPPIREALI